MGIIGWILLGIVGGVIAKALLPGNDPGGLIVTIIIGVVGALLGGFLARALGFGDPIPDAKLDELEVLGQAPGDRPGTVGGVGDHGRRDRPLRVVRAPERDARVG